MFQLRHRADILTRGGLGLRPAGSGVVFGPLAGERDAETMVFGGRGEYLDTFGQPVETDWLTARDLLEPL